MPTQKQFDQSERKRQCPLCTRREDLSDQKVPQ